MPQPKSALVTGASGFLGTHLCDALAKAGVTLTCLYRDVVNSAPFWKAQKSWGGRWHSVRGDVLDLALLERVIAEYEVDTVYHLAAQTQVSVGAADPMGTFRTNIDGTLNVLEACRRQKVRRVVVASTDKVYGSTQIPYTEANPLAERTPYGASKICEDVLAETYANTYGMSVAVTRCGNLYGPGHLNWSTLIPGTIRRIFWHERPVVRFGGVATRDFLFVRDAVAAYLKLGESAVCGAFNFSGGKPWRIIDVIQLITQLMGADINVFVQEEAKGEIQAQWLDCTKAKGELGWTPLIPLEDGLRATIPWYMEYFEALHGIGI